MEGPQHQLSWEPVPVSRGATVPRSALAVLHREPTSRRPASRIHPRRPVRPTVRQRELLLARGSRSANDRGAWARRSRSDRTLRRRIMHTL